MNWRGILGIVFVCCGAALTIIAMATLQWRLSDQPDSKTTYGLIDMSNCNSLGVCTTQSIAQVCDSINNPPACVNIKSQRDTHTHRALA